MQRLGLGSQSQYLGMCTAHDDCDWLREKQTRQSVFASILECVSLEPDLSSALSAMERGLAIQDLSLSKVNFWRNATQRHAVDSAVATRSSFLEEDLVDGNVACKPVK